MIFVCVGSRDYQFNRLIKEIDNLVLSGSIEDSVFAQIGASTYIPVHLEYKRFTNKEEFEKYIEESSIIITHGGTGSIISALKKKKKVIVVPRQKKFKEHIDDHQFQIANVLVNQNHVLMVDDITKLGDTIKFCINHFIPTEYKNYGEIFNIIEDFIERS
ncbi:PssE/Cps14G family polysaccharide biosynthesis glycosyltransferase [Acholeplasma laidlawii]|uniref:PssE/Cps14G family polysaccharide biosynthesis glycosyltransferase n=1 Tax=Acholeplasma laidlawii TaxID=2148 RepID=UPI00253F85A7|nr:PssE/Cps14G family polysaccharide biosynthesis glycosyltransferase [Acholeplasma laidlawii]